MGKNKWLVVALFIGLMGIFMNARAEDRKALELPSKIDRVMVYQDRALVTRHVELTNLEPGIYEVILKDLPVRIQNESVRASSLDREKVKILDVEVKTYQLEKPPEERIRSLQEQVQALKDQSRVINDNMKLLQMEKDYLNTTKKTFFKTAVQPVTIVREKTKEEQQIPRLTTNDYNEMLAFLTTKLRDNAKAIQAEEIKQRDIKKKMSFLQAELNKLGIGHSAIPRKKSVKVSIEVLKAGSDTLEISYINYNTSWRPSYDIRVLSEDKEMEVIGYGVVSQKSGEDWPDVKLSFSTAQPALRGWLPELKPLYATLPKKVPARTYTGKKQRERGFRYQDVLNKEILDQQRVVGDRDGSIISLGEIEFKGPTTPEASAYLPSEAISRFGSVVFHTPKRTDIVGDGAPHRTAISQQKFPIKFEYITCPKTSPHAYLKVLGTNTMDVPFLRGNLNVFMGSDFVGSSFTSGILPTEEFELTLSVDENIRVSRKLEEKGEKGPGFLGSRKKITYIFLIKIANYKKENIIINVIDQIPVSQNKEVTIEPGKFSDEPVEKEKDGKLKWRFELKPKEVKELTFSFSVYVPKKQDPAFYNKSLPVFSPKQELMRRMKK